MAVTSGRIRDEASSGGVWAHQPTVLMGPGPSPVHPSVLQAMAAPTLGHLDPRFLALMDETVHLLKQVFETANPLTLPVSGTGTAGMQAALENLIEPGDRVVVGIHGFFGERMADIAGRLGARVERVEVPWGQALEPEALRRVLASGGPARLVALVHAETSTGVLQPLEEVVKLAHEHGALVVVDAVTSLGGVPVSVDARGIDACYSGSQKCLGCPPGLAPITLGEAAQKRLHDRAHPIGSLYLDLRMVGRYWDRERLYHHTAPVNMVFGLHAALRRVLEEGLVARFGRHRQVGRALAAGLEGLGLRLAVVDPALRAPSLTTVWVPEGVDDAALRRELLEVDGIEIGGGLGPWKGRVWRIGTMGEGARPRYVFQLLGALGRLLRARGVRVDIAAGLAAAQEALAAPSS